MTARRRFFENLFKHPGTWVLIALGLVVFGIGAAPTVATALVICAAAAMVGAVVTLPFYLNRWRKNVFTSEGDYNYNGKKLHVIRDNKLQVINNVFVEKHLAQGIAVAFAVVGFITFLGLTIGFFAGGAAFMAPVFTALASPFAAFVSTSGISLLIPVLAGFCFVIAPLVVFNNLKRFFGWVDSFKYDRAHEVYQGKRPAFKGTYDTETPNYQMGENPREDRKAADYLISERGYLRIIGGGVLHVFEKGLESPYMKEVVQEEEKVQAQKSSYVPL